MEIRENRVLNDVTVRCLDQDLGKRYCNKESKLGPYRNRFTACQACVYWPQETKKKNQTKRLKTKTNFNVTEHYSIYMYNILKMNN